MTDCPHQYVERHATATNPQGRQFVLRVLHCTQCNGLWTAARRIGTEHITDVKLDPKVWLLCGPPRGEPDMMVMDEVAP